MALATRSSTDRDALIAFAEKLSIPPSWKVPPLQSKDHGPAECKKAKTGT